MSLNIIQLIMKFWVKIAYMIKPLQLILEVYIFVRKNQAVIIEVFKLVNADFNANFKNYNWLKFVLVFHQIYCWSQYLLKLQLVIPAVANVGVDSASHQTLLSRLSRQLSRDSYMKISNLLFNKILLKIICFY